MKIIYKTGNLLHATEKMICHGCNAQGMMGSGVAGEIRKKYPSAFETYRREYMRNGLRLGQTIWVPCNPHVVINAITQEFYGGGAAYGTVYVDYNAVRTVIQDLDSVVQTQREMRGLLETTAIAFPLIGAGLAGGSWKKISSIIEDEALHFQPVVYLLDGKIPES